MYETAYAATVLYQSQEARYAARAPQMLARRELELLQATASQPPRTGRSLRQAVAGIGARLRGTAAPRPATSR